MIKIDGIRFNRPMKIENAREEVGYRDHPLLSMSKGMYLYVSE